MTGISIPNLPPAISVSGSEEIEIVQSGTSRRATISQVFTNSLYSISFGTTGLTPATPTVGAVTVSGTLNAANGGTGFSSYTTGDLLYASGASTLGKLADVATGSVLLSGGVGVAPAWGKVDVSNMVSGTLAAANGGTGFSSYTIGDLLYASGASTLSRLADVATGNVLISGGVGVAPSWGKVDVSNSVSGILGVSNGGTGTSTTLTAGSVVFAGPSGVYTQDSANLFWDDTNNRLGVGTNAPAVAINAQSTGAAAEIRASGIGGIVSAHLSANNANGPNMIMNKSRGTVSTKTAVASGDTIGTIQFQVYGGSTDRALCTIRSVVDTYTSDTNISGYLTFFTTASTAAFERMRIDASGNVLVGLTTATGVAKLQVSGPLRTTGYTVATLPAGTVGMRTYVTDALAPVALSTVAGGGAVTVPVFYNGTNWIVA